MENVIFKISPKRIVEHEFINKMLTRRVHHEWLFINYLYRAEMIENPEIATIFALFVARYYPNYKWHFYNKDDFFNSVLLECAYHDQKFTEHDLANLNHANLNIDLTNSMLFGNIVTDFLIRYRGYSLMYVSGQKIIVTAKQDCQKTFEEQLYDGFTLFRKAKIGTKEVPFIYRELYPHINYLFYKLPVLPTRDIGYPFEEFIEDTNGIYQRVLRNKTSQ